MNSVISLQNQYIRVTAYLFVTEVAKSILLGIIIVGFKVTNQLLNIFLYSSDTGDKWVCNETLEQLFIVQESP
jgi:hypothetical protein